MLKNLNPGTKFLAVALPSILVLITIAVCWALSPVTGLSSSASGVGIAAVLAAVAALVGSAVALRLLDGAPSVDPSEMVDPARVDDIAPTTPPVEPDVRGVMQYLAGESQELVGRQIELIDRMEFSEDDPARLEQLFALDQLANRMRRNADTMLVVADGEIPQWAGDNVAIVDVIRVAMNGIEEYRQVELAHIDDVTVVSSAAVAVAQTVAELLENAVQFSPPSESVTISAVSHDDALLITVIDRGIGMSDADRGRHNEALANPGSVSESADPSLGFFIAGRLADRVGATVELGPTAGGGTTAQLALGAALVAAPSTPVASLAPPLPPAMVPASDLGIDAMARPVVSQRVSAETVVPPATIPAPPTPPKPPTPPGALVGRAPEKLADALPTGDQFDADVAQLLSELSHDQGVS